jgi:hypothetical protein
VPKPLAIGVVALVLGCSTQYTPEPSPRIHVVMVGGMPAYEKNGETHSHGFAGSGLVDAVEDDPEALEAAETYHGRTVGGVIAMIGGLVCGIAGIVVIASDNTDEQKTTIGTATLVCMLGGSVAGVVLISSAQPYQWDAINIYNDNVERKRRRYWYPTYPAVPRAPVGAPPPPPPPAPIAPLDGGADSG